MSKLLIPKVFPQKFWLRKIVCQYIPFAKYSDSCGGDSKEPPKDQSSSPGASSRSIYDTRKYGHKLPCDSVRPTFEPVSGVPTGVFRCTDGECLGRGACKGSYYQNPEYFSFHHMTFYDFHLILRPCRQASPISGRKK